jgi:hypothetical protein
MHSLRNFTFKQRFIQKSTIIFNVFLAIKVNLDNSTNAMINIQ